MRPKEKIEDFLRRYWYEGNRALWVVVLVVLVALLLVRRIRVLRVLVPAAIGGIVVIVVILLSPPRPLLNSTGPVVKNGVAAIVVCGNKRDGMLMSATDLAPEPQTGSWSVESRGSCEYYYHHPPDATQRANRHERAEQTAIAACGTKRDLAAVLKRIPEPATGTWGTEPRGTCRVQYPHPPDRWQRMAWHERAL
jgi:hypothetical protein